MSWPSASEMEMSVFNMSHNLTTTKPTTILNTQRDLLVEMCKTLRT